jgi:hypothetical protein
VDGGAIYMHTRDVIPLNVPMAYAAFALGAFQIFFPVNVFGSLKFGPARRPTHGAPLRWSGPRATRRRAPTGIHTSTARRGRRWTTFHRTNGRTSEGDAVNHRVLLLLCPVCSAPTDAVVRESLNLGIFVLLGVTGVVLAAIARFMVAIARRSREAALHDVENA